MIRTKEQEWQAPEGVWVITFTMPDSEVTVAGDYAIPIHNNNLMRLDALEKAKQLFPAGHFATETVIDFVPKGAEDYIW